MLAGELSRELTLLDTPFASLLAGYDGYHAIQGLPGIGPVLGAVIGARPPVRHRRAVMLATRL
jgi:hypothetical protein